MTHISVKDGENQSNYQVANNISLKLLKIMARLRESKLLNVSH